MTVFYLDTSALVKRYVRETGTEWIRLVTDPRLANTLLIAEIGMVEAAAAIAAKHRATQGITLGERDVAVRLLVQHCHQQYQLIPSTRLIVDRALLLTQEHHLRGYDAMHLATALIANAVLVKAGNNALTVVVADRALRTIAEREGLAVENPEEHQ